MAMTAQVKAELANTQITKTCCRKAEVASMLRFAGGIHIVSGRIVVEAELDKAVADRGARLVVADLAVPGEPRHDPDRLAAAFRQIVVEA